MIRTVRHFLFVLIAFAIVGGTSRQLAQAAESAAPVTMAAMPCTMMMQTAMMQTAMMQTAMMQTAMMQTAMMQTAMMQTAMMQTAMMQTAMMQTAMMQTAMMQTAMMQTAMMQTAMMQTADAGHGMPMLPCKGMDHDCIKLTGCIAAAALPARFGGGDLAATFTTVRYWSAMSKLGDRVSPPEPLPPRTI